VNDQPHTLRKTGAVIKTLTNIAVIAAALLAAGLGSEDVFAQSDYPAHAITMIVPFSAGGPTDVVGRVIAESMSHSLGQQIVVENVVGAGGTTGTTRAVRAAPDGYTLVLGNMGTHAAAVGLYPNLAYNPATDFAPIGMVVKTPVFVLARKDLPANNLAEFVSYAKQHAAELTMAHAGVGSVSYVTCQLFNSILGLRPKMVSYQGTGPAMYPLISGHVDYMCDQVVNVVPQVLAGNIKAYLVDTPARNPALPDIPTATEAGLRQFDASAWIALFAPKNTPQPIIANLNAALRKSLDADYARKRLVDLGGDIPDSAASSPDALAALVKREIARWKPILTPVEAMSASSADR
jgi:tripartite-type tricarboxylate transporter receptor subunit TctC